jgi:hypothetical protein
VIKIWISEEKEICSWTFKSCVHFSTPKQCKHNPLLWLILLHHETNSETFASFCRKPQEFYVTFTNFYLKVCTHVDMYVSRHVCRHEDMQTTHFSFFKVCPVACQAKPGSFCFCIFSEAPRDPPKTNIIRAFRQYFVRQHFVWQHFIPQIWVRQLRMCDGKTCALMLSNLALLNSCTRTPCCRTSYCRAKDLYSRSTRTTTTTAPLRTLASARPLTTTSSTTWPRRTPGTTERWATGQRIADSGDPLIREWPTERNGIKFTKQKSQFG